MSLIASFTQRPSGDPGRESQALLALLALGSESRDRVNATLERAADPETRKGGTPGF